MDSKSIENRQKCLKHQYRFLFIFWYGFQIVFDRRLEPEWERILLQVESVEFMQVLKKRLVFNDFGRSGDRLHGHRFSKNNQ